MKGLATRLLIRLLERAGRWAQPARNRAGAALGDLLWWFVPSRRRIAMTNLRLCFPDWTEAQRRRTARRCFRNVARAAIDHGVLATATRPEIERYVRMQGVERLTDPGLRPLILIAPHFVGLDAGGVAASTRTHVVSIYARGRNAQWDRWLHDIRSRFNAARLIQRGGSDLRGVVRALQEGLPFYYLPDQDPGPRNGIFVPFLGVPAATLPMVSRLARMTGAKVAMCVTEMTADGYVLHVEPPWTEFPTDSIEDDAARMNAAIERWVRRLPDQYLWTHRRFKTRPAGEPDLY